MTNSAAVTATNSRMVEDSGTPALSTPVPRPVRPGRPKRQFHGPDVFRHHLAQPGAVHRRIRPELERGAPVVLVRSRVARQDTPAQPDVEVDDTGVAVGDDLASLARVEVAGVDHDLERGIRRQTLVQDRPRTGELPETFRLPDVPEGADHRPGQGDAADQ